MSEHAEAVGWWGRRVGLGSALADWVRGLPSALQEPADLHPVGMLAGREGVARPQGWTALLLAVRAPRNGHVCLDLDAPGPVVRGLEEELDVDPEGWLEGLEGSSLVGRPGATTPFVLDGRRLYTARWFRYEAGLAAALGERFAVARAPEDASLLKEGLRQLFPRDARLGTAIDRQQLAAAMAVLRGAAVVSGGPGTGKTWTVRNLLLLLYAQWASDPARGEAPRIAVAAPTGKAAARVVQSIRKDLSDAVDRALAVMPAGVERAALHDWLDHLPPWTLHRLLGWRPDTPTRFRHGPDAPLPYDVVLVDEASMVDVALMAKLVAALRSDARLILLGDRNQLASVEAGTVLADVCGGERAEGEVVRLSPAMREALASQAGLALDRPGSGVVAVEQPGPWDGIAFLTRSRRFDAGSGIGKLARACVSGDAREALAVARLWEGEGPGPLVVEPGTGRVVGRDVGRLEPTRGGDLPAAARGLIDHGYRPVLERLAVGAPSDPAARIAWVRGLLDDFERFRVLAAHRRGPLGVEALNDAIVRHFAQAGLLDPTAGAWFVGRPILITRNDHGLGRFNGDVGLVVPAASGSGVRVAFPHGDDAIEELSPARLPDHETVFAMTIHKSQGSEHADVLVVLPPRSSPILTRELVYTGVTRAQLRVTLLARAAILEEALQARVARATGLADRLWNGEAPAQ